MAGDDDDQAYALVKRTIGESVCVVCAQHTHTTFVRVVEPTGVMHMVWHCMNRPCFERARELACDTQGRPYRMMHTCTGCKKMRLVARGDPENRPARCGRCRVASYCCAACQRRHWPEHKTVCPVPEEDTSDQ